MMIPKDRTQIDSRDEPFDQVNSRSKAILGDQPLVHSSMKSPGTMTSVLFLPNSYADRSEGPLQPLAQVLGIISSGEQHSEPGGASRCRRRNAPGPYPRPWFVGSVHKSSTSHILSTRSPSTRFTASSSFS
ncbi:hypothetical protein LshimejAT787_1104950 [Lyophyllum shimeji]|uniref:Uncharacterized protein n=1 Tax=Lyophyllum shimeji TaxID=47721 RepID=A0A9P3PTD5_LYOSH|nr:hypothetical protein LshimejAT787_1104950 [Lyophyllum shimeji]